MALSWVAACIVASGALVYGYLALVAHALPAGEYADFGAYWSIALIVGFGAFLPVELELARLLPSRPGGAPLPPGTLAVTGALVLGSLLALLAGLPFVVPAVGGVGVVLPLIALCVVSGGQFLLRGLLLGTGRLRLHGTLLVLDAALRVGAALAVVVLLPGAGPAAFAWTLVAAIALAHLPVLVVLGRVRHREPAAPDDGGARAFAGAIGPLMLGTLCAQVLLNATPVLVSAMAGTGEHVLASQFTATFTLVRLPLFVAVPLQSALVPVLTRVTATGEPAALRRFVVRLTAGIAVLAAVGGLLGLSVGHPLVSLLFGARYALPPGTTALLAVGSGLHLGLLVVSQAVLAAGLHRQVAAVWVTGLVAGGVVLALVPDLVLRATLAFTLGSAAALVVGAVVLLHRHRDPAGPAVATPQESSRRARH